jgi:SAM-dependent methyltransferase
MNVIWHDLECGSYAEDLALWRGLAAEYGDPVLDVGAGTGRITLDLARAGHRVTALDLDAELLGTLESRAGALEVETVCADARTFDLDGRRFPLCIVPMQTIQLLGGPDGRIAFLRRVAAHLELGGRVAIAISEQLEPFEVLDGIPGPVPDMCEIDGIVYASHPTAVRTSGREFVLERRREVVSVSGEREVSDDRITLDRLTAQELRREAAEVGLRGAGSSQIPSTDEYVGSTVVMLDA